MTTVHPVSQGKKHTDSKDYLCLDEQFIFVSFWALLAAPHSWGFAFLFPLLTWFSPMLFIQLDLK